MNLTQFLNYIVWDPNPAVIPGFDRLRWYSLLFALGFILSQQFMVYFFRKEGHKEELVDKLRCGKDFCVTYQAMVPIWENGGCIGNPGPGGWAAILVQDGDVIHFRFNV